MFNSEKYSRRSIRLKGYNYSQHGGYFVTICAESKKCIFCRGKDGEMELNNVGKIINAEWLKTAEIRKDVELDQYIIMPNHFHGIIFIVDDDCRGKVHGRGMARHAPTTFGKPVAGSLSTIIGAFKSAVSRQANKIKNTNLSVWQRNYFEHIIRNEKELNRIREYIINNPVNWQRDRDNPFGKPDKEEKMFWKEFT